MKKLSFFLMAMLFSVMSFAAETVAYTLTPAATGGNSSPHNAYASAADWTYEGITWNVTGNSYMVPWRIGGKSITAQDRAVYTKTAMAADITKIEITHATVNITCNSCTLTVSDAANGAGETFPVKVAQNTTTTITLPEGDYSNKFYKLVYNVTNSTTSNKYVQLSEIKFYTEVQTSVEAPTFTPEEGKVAANNTFAEPFALTIASATTDATIKYTLDGTDPTLETALTYEAPITISTMVQVRAIAVKGEEKSVEASVAYIISSSEAKPYTASEAIAAEALGLTGTVYVTGTVKSIEELSTQYGNATYNITDGTKELKIYRGKNLEKAKFTSADQLLVGDVVVVKGDLTSYNGAAQLGQDNYLISRITAPTTYTVTVTAENGTVEGAGEYEEGKEATLTATANEGYEFVNWTVDGAEVSTENPYKFTVTADIALVANFKAVVVEPVMETVYFVNALNWTGTINAYAWTTDPNAAWPGAAATKEAEKIGGYDVYSYTAEAGKYANVIFNGTGGQTADLKWTAGKYYVLDGWYTKEEAETKLAAPLPETWNIVGAAGLMGTDWNLNDAKNAMTKQADGTYLLEKKDITLTAGTYEYKAAKDHGYTVAIPQDGNQKLTISKSGIYDITFVLNVTAKKLTATATLKKEAVVIPTVVIAGDMNSWNQTKDKFTMAADSLTATFKATLAVKNYGFKMIVGGSWHSDGKTITRAANSTKFTGANSNTNSTLKADIAGEYLFTWEYATKTLTVTYPALPVKYNVNVTAENGTVTGAGTYEEGKTATLTATPAEGYEFVNWTVGEEVVSTENPYSFVVTADVALAANFKEVKPEIEWEEIGLEITNLTTEVMEVEGKKYLQLNGRNDMMDADVMLFLNNYADVDDDYEVNAESSLMTFGGLELTVLEGVMTQTSETDKGTIYTGTVYASVTDEEEGGTMYVKFALTMYAAPATVLELTDAIVAINEELGTLTFNVPTGEGEGYLVELAGYTAPGVHEGPQICLLETPEVVAYTNYAETSVADGVITLKGEFTSFMGDKFDLTISGKLPVEEPVEKPEPTYTENNLNPYAFGLESVLSDDKTTLTVTYRLNNSNATSVNVLVYNGEDIVASIPGTTTIGKNTVEVATGNLPAGVELKWAVEVNGTSVEAPTQETKMYNLYCPHGLAIDTDPESENFGRILVAEAMQAVPASGYVTSGKGAGLYVFNPSFTTDSTVYTGGNDFTRILASNGYQPWRVKISEDGRIFVSSLDLNGVVVWEVSKDLQTWTPVIAGTNDATDHNIYDADGNFVAGLNCSMDVTGKGEDLKLLLYSTNNKGIAFNQSGYRLDEYALGTATTWTGTPKNILEGGKLGVVHTNVEFIYDGEGGYWFGGSRAGNAGQPNLVHINAAGEQDYYTEDASLYGGDGVLVHNGMLFKGKARTSGTVGNFGVWTIGKDADGKVTLTEKWAVVADGIGRNLNEFEVDYAENLYVVGNSGEKIIAYALPYSGQVETPAAAKYAFQLPEPLKMVGTVKRAVQNGDQVIVLTHEENGAAHIYQVVDGKAIAEVSQEGVVPVDTENPGSYLAISDIAVTEDGKLVANNYVRNQFAGTTPEAGYKLGTSYYYIWNDLAGAPAVWFTSQTTARSSHGDVGVTFALKGTSTNAELLVTAVHNNNRAVRLAKYNVIDGQYVEPNIPGGQQSSEYYEYFGTHTKEAYYQEAVQGKQFQLNVSPLGEGRWIMDGELVNPSEFVLPAVGENYEASATLTEDLGKKYNGASYVTVGEKVLMVAPFANPDGQLVGAEILDITKGLDAPQYVDMVYVDEAVAATAAATAVEVVEGGLNITLVADAAIHTWFVELSEGPEYQVYEDAITNLVIDYDNLLLIGGPSDAFQVEVVLGLGDFDRNTGAYQLLPASTISVMGSEATFIDGVASVDGIEQSATAVVHCTWNGMAIEFHLTMTSAPMEATKVVVENATVEIEKVLLFGDMYDYALKMTGVWHNEEDGLDYPVLVEVPVYYPEATEPSEIMSTVTVGGWGDNDPWLGFGEGTLTVTTVGNVITATGIVQNPMAGVAIDITISGSTLTDDLENTTVTLKTVKMIQNGQLIIKKGDAQYNAQGAIVK